MDTNNQINIEIRLCMGSSFNVFKDDKDIKNRFIVLLNTLLTVIKILKYLMKNQLKMHFQQDLPNKYICYNLIKMYISHQQPPRRLDNNPFAPLDYQTTIKGQNNNNIGYPKPSQFPVSNYDSPNNVKTYHYDNKPQPFDPYSYNFHVRSQNQQQNFSRNSPQGLQNQPRHHKTLANETIENKSFLDNFDNNSSSMLNQEKSYARNIKGRLFNNNDPTIENAKQQKMREYRDQLQRQMQADKDRKQQQRKKIQEQQLNRQKKFYEQFKIQAQGGKNENKSNENPYIMMRTQRMNKKNNLKNITDDNINDKSEEKIDKAIFEQKRSRRRPYSKMSNQQTYNNFHQIKKKKMNDFQENLAKQREYQEERIAKILLFQRNVLQKLTDIKKQIRATDHILDTSGELEKVRNSLKARSNFKHFSEDLQKSGFKEKGPNNINQYYSLPRKNLKPILPPVKNQRYNVRLNDLKRKDALNVSMNSINPQKQQTLRNMEQNAQSRIISNQLQHKQVLNDKNIIGEELKQQQQENS